MRFFVFALVLVGMAGCGKEEAASSSGNAVVVVTDGVSPCTQRIIDDNNSLVRTCSAMTTIEQGRICKSETQAFLNKYPGVNCLAVNEKTKAEMTLKAEDYRELVRKLEELGV